MRSAWISAGDAEAVAVLGAEGVFDDDDDDGAVVAEEEAVVIDDDAFSFALALAAFKLATLASS